MRRIDFVICMVVLVLPAVLQAQTQAQTQTGNVEQELRKLENAWNEALVKHDWAFIDRILADDYITTDSDGVVANTVQEMAILNSGEEAVTFAVADDFKVRVYGDAAVVTFRWTYKGQAKGKESAGQERYTDTWLSMAAVGGALPFMLRG